MANAISVRVLKYGHEEFGTTDADAQTMMLSTEHIIYGTNVETLMDVTLTGGTAASDVFNFSGQTGLTTNEYIRLANVGDSVGALDVGGSDLTPGIIYKVKDVNGGDNPTLQANEAGLTVDVTTGATGLTLEAYRVQGELIYADTQNNGRPIKIRTVEPCVNSDNVFGVAMKSTQLHILELDMKNGVTYDADTITENNIMLNTDRVILTYEDANASGDFNVWYDTSNTNKAGLDSPFCDFLNINHDWDTHPEDFINHIGGVTNLASLTRLTVNGNLVAFPDISASGLIRLDNIASAYELGTDTYIKLKGSGKPGWDTLIISDTLAQTVAMTDATHIVE